MVTKATPLDYLSMSEAEGEPTQQQPPDQPVRLFHPNPGTATATNNTELIGIVEHSQELLYIIRNYCEIIGIIINYLKIL